MKQFKYIKLYFCCSVIASCLDVDVEVTEKDSDIGILLLTFWYIWPRNDIFPVYIKGSCALSGVGNKDIFLNDLINDFFLKAFFVGGVGDAL